MFTMHNLTISVANHCL